jgi:hypothetical protein
MNYVICPEGTGEINIHMDSGEASNLLSQLNHMVEEFDWDDYILSILRDLLNRGITDVRAAGGPSVQHPIDDFDPMSDQPFSDENISRLGHGMHAMEYRSNIERATEDDPETR